MSRLSTERDLVGVFLDQVGEPVQDRGSFGDGERTPGSRSRRPRLRPLRRRCRRRPGRPRASGPGIPVEWRAGLEGLGEPTHCATDQVPDRDRARRRRRPGEPGAITTSSSSTVLS